MQPTCCMASAMQQVEIQEPLAKHIKILGHFRLLEIARFNARTNCKVHESDSKIVLLCER